MTLKQLDRLVDEALENVKAEIAALGSGSRTGAGVAGEGFAGGYRQALFDVSHALRGNTGPASRGLGWWPDPDRAGRRR